MSNASFGSTLQLGDLVDFAVWESRSCGYAYRLGRVSFAHSGALKITYKERDGTSNTHLVPSDSTHLQRPLTYSLSHKPVQAEMMMAHVEAEHKQKSLQPSRDSQKRIAELEAQLAAATMQRQVIASQLATSTQTTAQQKAQLEVQAQLATRDAASIATLQHRCKELEAQIAASVHEAVQQKAQHDTALAAAHSSRAEQRMELEQEAKLQQTINESAALEKTELEDKLAAAQSQAQLDQRVASMDSFLREWRNQTKSQQEQISALQSQLQSAEARCNVAEFTLQQITAARLPQDQLLIATKAADELQQRVAQLESELKQSQQSTTLALQSHSDQSESRLRELEQQLARMIEGQTSGPKHGSVSEQQGAGSSSAVSNAVVDTDAAPSTSLSGAQQTDEQQPSQLHEEAVDGSAAALSAPVSPSRSVSAHSDGSSSDEWKVVEEA